jgi:hypothetical protein
LIDNEEHLSVEEYAKKLQERMKVEGDGPAYLKALEFLSKGRLAIRHNEMSIVDKNLFYDELFLDNRILPYCGCRLSS